LKYKQKNIFYLYMLLLVCFWLNGSVT